MTGLKTPEPKDYKTLELFEVDYDKWVNQLWESDDDIGQCEEGFINAKEIWDQYQFELPKTKPTVGTLFMGGGGADLGLEAAGFKSIWGIERDPKIARVAQANFPDSLVINRCISDINPRGLKPVDLLWMSPPCQQYSNARRGVNANHKDKDAGLYCLPYLSALMPRWVILENVPAYSESPAFGKILERLKLLGYRYHHQILNASDYGVPQNRKRLIMIASAKGEKLPWFPFPGRRVGWYEAIAHLIPSLPDSKLADWQLKRLQEVQDRFTGIDLIDSGKNTTRLATVNAAPEPSFTITTDHINSHAPLVLMPRAGANIKSVVPSLANEPCPTIRAFTEGGHTHWADVIDFRDDLIIKQVIPEATARLQTFPDSYQFPESKSLAQQIIGNAVPPLLAKELGLAILKSIN